MAVLVTGGAGYIGSHMVWELVDAGEEVVVWNRTRERADATGLDAADCPCELAEQVETVITSLFDDPAVEADVVAEQLRQIAVHRLAQAVQP